MNIPLEKFINGLFGLFCKEQFIQDRQSLVIFLNFGVAFVLLALKQRIPFMKQWMDLKDEHEGKIIARDVSETRKKFYYTVQHNLVFVRLLETIGTVYFLAGPFVLYLFLYKIDPNHQVYSKTYVFVSNVGALLISCGFVSICYIYVHHRILRYKWPLEEVLRLLIRNIEVFVVK